MKPCLFVLFALLLANQINGQPVKPTPTQQADTSYKQYCDCRALITRSEGLRYIPSEAAANEAVAELLTLIRTNSSLNYTTAIVVRAAGCDSPKALICPTSLTNKKSDDVPLILYNTVFMEGINKKMALMTRVDRHILAHEISHHVLEHLKNTDSEAIPRVLQATGDTNRIQRRFKVNNQQATEIQADFFGLWVLSLLDKSLDFESFVSEFDTDYIRRYLEPNHAYNATHPSFKDRISAMRRFWRQLQLHELQQKGISRGYFANSASISYLELHPERIFWDLGVVAGLTVAGQPKFSVGGVPVDGLLYRAPNAYNLYMGLQLTRFKWQKPWQLEAEVAYSTQKYGTLIGSKPAQRLLETLDIQYVTIFPKATWIPFGRNSNRFAAHRFGVFVSAGPMFRKPVGFTYENQGSTVAVENVPKLKPSVNFRASIGVELLRKSFRPGSYKIALSYEYSHIQLATTPKPNALSHNLDVTFHASFARW